MFSPVSQISRKVINRKLLQSFFAIPTSPSTSIWPKRVELLDSTKSPVQVVSSSLLASYTWDDVTSDTVVDIGSFLQLQRFSSSNFLPRTP
ncbi:hypothetical protein EYZ11_003825 [Aspergillus tanneri]|uniref:Uncharacterized protein n=1 Tax=Aspergillus tanneri TaxID=1220188 RepID=A0A4S3JM60_9EURO|nr:hypothetical protein EYZ11_003825 [Aspergillus tanneri]